MVIFFSDKDIVLPGDLLAEGVYKTSGLIYVRDGKTYSKVVGLIRVEEKALEVIPLKGRYIPSEGDVVVGKILDVGATNWIVDINSPYPAVLPAAKALPRRRGEAMIDLNKVFNVGDLIVAKVVSFDLTRDPLITTSEPKLGKVTEGTLVEITPAKVPRVIGRKGSMITMIKRLLDVRIVVGRNGRVLVVGKDRVKELYAVMAVKKIEREAHIPGLTDRTRDYIRNLLEKGGG